MLLKLNLSHLVFTKRCGRSERRMEGGGAIIPGEKGNFPLS